MSSHPILELFNGAIYGGKLTLDRNTNQLERVGRTCLGYLGQEGGMAMTTLWLVKAFITRFYWLLKTERDQPTIPP